MARKNKIVFIICDNIRSAHNVGSIFRTADAAGVAKIILSGMTPAPIDRFGRAQKNIQKTALGAEKNIPWEKIKNAASLLDKLKQQGFFIVALEQQKGSVNYRKFNPKFPMALVLGSEVGGVTKFLLKKSDKIIEIPMVGKKESLNVAVALGVAIFAILS